MRNDRTAIESTENFPSELQYMDAERHGLTVYLNLSKKLRTMEEAET